MDVGGRPRKPMTTTHPRPDKPFLTVDEVVLMTGTHKHTVQARLRDGTLKGKKLGGVWKIYADSLVYEKVHGDLNIEKGGTTK